MSQAPDESISPAASVRYWNSISTTVDGMLGGYPEVSRTDLKGSANFLAKIRRTFPSPSGDKVLHRGVDFGAGIGRVTAGFLSTVCNLVDIVEPIEKFAKEIRTIGMVGEGSIDDIYVSGLEHWKPEKQYDLLWHQWCVGYVNDGHLVEHLKRCKKAITADGWIIIKENISTDPDGKDVFDETDSSVTRTDEKFRQLFKDADVRLIKTEIQKGFTKGLLPVRMYALRS